MAICAAIATILKWLDEPNRLWSKLMSTMHKSYQRGGIWVTISTHHFAEIPKFDICSGPIEAAMTSGEVLVNIALTPDIARGRKVGIYFEFDHWFERFDSRVECSQVQVLARLNEQVGLIG